MNTTFSNVPPLYPRDIFKYRGCAIRISHASSFWFRCKLLFRLYLPRVAHWSVGLAVPIRSWAMEPLTFASFSHLQRLNTNEPPTRQQSHSQHLCMKAWPEPACTVERCTAASWFVGCKSRFALGTTCGTGVGARQLGSNGHHRRFCFSPRPLAGWCGRGGGPDSVPFGSIETACGPRHG